jgi:hypothetical protein
MRGVVHTFVYVSPFLLLMAMLWTAWRVLAVFRAVMVPARVREVVPSGDGSLAHLLLDTRERDGTQGEAWVAVPAHPPRRPGQAVTLWRGARLSVSHWNDATLSFCVMGGVAVVWALLYAVLT